MCDEKCDLISTERPTLFLDFPRSNNGKTTVLTEKCLHSNTYN